MKIILLAMGLLLVAPVAHAQKGKEAEVALTLPVDPDSHLVAYTGVVDTPGATQVQLYSRAYEWVAKNYNSAQKVIQMQDKDAGKLIVKGRTTAYFKGHEFGWITHTLSIYVKDGKYKYDITDFKHDSDAFSYGNFEQVEPTYIPGAAKGTAKKTWDEMKRSTNTEMKATIASLQAAMTAKTKDKSDF
jgi:hypothetical protein